MNFSYKDGYFYIGNNILKTLNPELLKNPIYKLYAYIDTSIDSKVYLKFGLADLETIWQRYISTGIRDMKGQMIAVWESNNASFDEEAVHDKLQSIGTSENAVGFIWAGKKGQNVNTEEAYELLSEDAVNLILDIISKTLDRKPLEKDQSETYEDIIRLTSEVLKVHSKGVRNFILDLCARWGKTRTNLELLKNSECRVCFMCSYVGTVKASYKKDIETIISYENMKFIDPDLYESPNECIKACENFLKENPSNKIMYYVALTGTYSEETEEFEDLKDDELQKALSTFERRTTGVGRLKSYKCMMVTEEADFGASCPKQTKKLYGLYSEIGCKFSISTTGTNIEKTISIVEKFDVKAKNQHFCYIKRDYIIDVLGSFCRPNSVGIDWQVLNNSDLKERFGYEATSLENNSDFFKIKDGHFKNESYILDLIKFIFEIDRSSLNLKRGPKNIRENSNIQNTHMIDLEASSMIYTPSGYDTHEHLAKLINTYFSERYLAAVIDGKTTTNEAAETYAKNILEGNELHNKINGTNRQIIFIATGMANRSFSIKQIKNIILFTNSGSYASITQKIARGFTPWNASHNINHIIDLRLEYNSDICLNKYLSGLGCDAIDNTTTLASNEIIPKIMELTKEASPKITFGEYDFNGLSPLRKLSEAELEIMMKSTSFYKKKTLSLEADAMKIDLNETFGDSLQINLSKAKKVLKTKNYKGDTDKFFKKKSNKILTLEEKNRLEEEKKQQNKKEKHFYFFVENFQAYFNSGKWTTDILRHEFSENMTEETKEIYSKQFDIDMNYICELANLFLEKNATEYFDIVEVD